MRKNLSTKTLLLQKYLPILNWLIATIFCVFQFYLQTTASLMTKGWAKDFHLSPVGVSNLSAAFFYAYLFMQVPVGYLNDRFDPRKILTFGACLVSIGCFLLSATHLFWLAFSARLLMGFGSSFGFISMLYITSRWFSPQKFTLMVGSTESVGMILVALASVLSAWFISIGGWRPTLFMSGCIAFTVMILAFIIVQDKPMDLEKSTQKISLIKGLWQSLANGQVWLSGLFGFFNFALLNAISSLWGVPFLHSVYHFSLSLSAAIVSMILYGMATGTPLVGWLSMKISRRKPLLLMGSAISSVLLSILFFVPHLSKATLFLLFFASGLSCASYIQCFSISKEHTPSSLHGISMAITNLIIMLGAPLYQYVIAQLIENHFFGLSPNPDVTFRLALGIVAVGFGISFFIALLMKETYCMSVVRREKGREYGTLN